MSDLSETFLGYRFSGVVDRLSKRTMDRQLKSDQEALRRLQDRYGADFQSKLSLDQRTKRSPK